MSGIAVPIEKRFWNKVNVTPTCWLWTAATMKDGYGKVQFRGKLVAAHRVSYIMHKGEIEKVDFTFAIPAIHLSV